MRYFRQSFIIFCFYLSGCTIPMTYDTRVDTDYIKYNCAETSYEMYVKRTIDKCPTFSSKPFVGDWRLVSLRNVNEEYKNRIIKRSRSTRWSTDKKKCYNPISNRTSIKTSYKLVPKGTSLSVHKITSMWDFENGSRTFYRGEIKIEGLKEKFSAEASLYRYEGVQEYMGDNFLPCSKKNTNKHLQIDTAAPRD